MESVSDRLPKVGMAWDNGGVSLKEECSMVNRVVIPLDKTASSSSGKARQALKWRRRGG